MFLDIRISFFQGPSEGMESMYGKDPQPEFANIPRIFQESSQKFGGEAPNLQQYSCNILGILANSAWRYFPYMLSIPSEGP